MWWHHACHVVAALWWGYNVGNTFTTKTGLTVWRDSVPVTGNHWCRCGDAAQNNSLLHHHNGTEWLGRAAWKPVKWQPWLLLCHPRLVAHFCLGIMEWHEPFSEIKAVCQITRALFITEGSNQWLLGLLISQTTVVWMLGWLESRMPSLPHLQ